MSIRAKRKPGRELAQAVELDGRSLLPKNALCRALHERDLRPHLDADGVVRRKDRGDPVRPFARGDDGGRRAARLPPERDPERPGEQRREDERPEDRLGIPEVLPEPRDDEAPKRATHRAGTFP